MFILNGSNASYQPCSLLAGTAKALKVGTLGDISAYIELYWVKNSVHKIVE
jgi:hypothetical protein